MTPAAKDELCPLPHLPKRYVLYGSREEVGLCWSGRIPAQQPGLCQPS